MSVPSVVFVNNASNTTFARSSEGISVFVGMDEGEERRNEVVTAVEHVDLLIESCTTFSNGGNVSSRRLVVDNVKCVAL